jgi:hypothetical protein
MNAVLQIARKRIWWILLALVILGVLFFRPSILGFKKSVERMKGGTKKGIGPAGKSKKTKKGKKKIN